MNGTPTPTAHAHYVPGYALPKLGLALLGLVLIAISFTKFGTVFRLAFTGASTTATAIRVVAVDAGKIETTYTSDAEVKAAEKILAEARDRSVVFWVEYGFPLPDGRHVEIRSPVGQVLKSMQPLRDDDGLPSTLKFWYDPRDPKNVIIPFQFLAGTWFPFGFGTFFIPGMFLLFGVVAVFMGLLLWWYAKKPIDIPDLSRAHGEADPARPPSGSH